MGELKQRARRQHVRRAQIIGEQRRMAQVLARQRRGVPERHRTAQYRHGAG